jgi:hypothetical protein
MNSVDDFTRLFKATIQSNEGYALLPGCGWLDGGCRSLMKAVVRWLGKDVTETWALRFSKKSKAIEHALVKVGNFFIDGDGASDLETFIKRWIYEEHAPGVILDRYDFDREPAENVPFYISDAGIDTLVAMISKNIDKNDALAILTGTK